jgi:putative membrane-bound dehydrogenase-like protein
MLVPEGFRVTLYAGEPHVRQPIAFAIDDRGRLWVAEAYNYPEHGTRSGDRIVIFNDQDGDGRFDQRTVFYDRLNYVTGIELGFGGAWVMSPPWFYFIPDRDGDDRPDEEPRIVLDGFGTHANAHNLANGFSWGPDGWLYGTHGRTNWSLPGVPGTPDAERIRFDGGVWRYHPVRDVWEPYADGTTNPWGIDWDDHGEAFVCNCVNPHLFHVIQGAHYEPWRNRESSQYAYERIATIADHRHFVGTTDIRAGIGSAAEDAAGGGHAHCGTMVYLGDNWPERYRNTLFTNNIHGRRINNDILRRAGSGYVASHGADVLRSQDPWYMGVTLRYGPDGSVFASDWSDTGECHSVRNTQRQTGRIYKISYGQTRKDAVDVGPLSDLDLVELQRHRNDWFVQHARRLLQERAAGGQLSPAVRSQLLSLYAAETDVPRRLRALWALHVIGGLDDEFLVAQLQSGSPEIRGWAVRLLCEDRDPPQAALDEFREQAAAGDSPSVRLQLASALQRLSPSARWPIAEALLSRGEDASDPNLPLMIWYGIEPLVEADLGRFVGLAEHSRLPRMARFLARRAVTHNVPAGLAVAVEIAPRLAAASQQELLAGMSEGLEGRRQVEMPAGWAQTYVHLQASPEATVRERSVSLALTFGDPRALVTLQRVAADSQSPAEVRTRAIQSLVAARTPDLAGLLLRLVSDPATRGAATRGLAEYDHPDTAEHLLGPYETFSQAHRQDAVLTLSSRPEWALALMDALESGAVPRSDLSAYAVRQMVALRHETLTARIQAVWGNLRPTSAEKEALIAALRGQLTPDALEQADRAAGRLLFEKTCANCHRLFDSGGAIGPDITGSQRTNLDYLLRTLVDPSAAVPRDFQVHVVSTDMGRVITGLLLAETRAALTLQTVNEKIVVPRNEVVDWTTSELSLMPEGMLSHLSNRQIRQLFAYLMGPGQVPLPSAGAGQ